MLLVTLMVALTLAPAQANAQRYAGTWIAEFEGTTFVRLELTPAGDTLTGRISLGNIEVNPEGAIRKATAVPAQMTPIFDIVVGDASLSFSRKESRDTDRFEMRRMGNDANLVLVPTEELRKELIAGGVPLPKPIRLRKISG